MTPEPLKNSHYPDLPHSLDALERAAQRAREIAARTGTAVVIQREGQIERLRPTDESVSTPVAGALEGIHR
jgi:hypothetical protein